LPPVQDGLEFTFVVQNTLTSFIGILSQTPNNVYGNIISSDGTAVTGGSISAKTNITIMLPAKIGDTYKYCCDGVKWYLNGVTGDHTSVSIT
jgi:hypothetical protein